MSGTVGSNDKGGSFAASASPATFDRKQLEILVKRRKELFGDCALIEIIHLHDCFRGSLFALEDDVGELLDQFRVRGNCCPTSEVERRIGTRLKVIWGVFRAHSSAEDEFIWPTLKRKTQECSRARKASGRDGSKEFETDEYAEDHVVLESRFSELHKLLANYRDAKDLQRNEDRFQMVRSINDKTKALVKHFLMHLENEEADYMPIVAKCLSKSEIHNMVGKIMGKRSADTIAKIMTMAVQSLMEEERIEMVEYMKEAMEGTFFDRWLSMSGWISSSSEGGRCSHNEPENRKRVLFPADNSRCRGSAKRVRREEQMERRLSLGSPPISPSSTTPAMDEALGSDSGLTKVIEAISANPELSPREKNATIQRVKDSVWKSYQRQKADSDT